MYIVFEGIIGTGKSTQTKKYAQYLEQKYPGKDILWTREPGGTVISEAIRHIAQGNEYKDNMDYICEAYLYAASRAQTLRQMVKPVLDNNGIVISDRSFLTSLTNQAFGRKLGFEKVYQINKAAIDGFMPDKIVFLDLPISIGLQRCFDKGGDKFESLGEDFYNDVYQGYKEISNYQLFKDRWVNINAHNTVENVFNDIVNSLSL